MLVLSFHQLAVGKREPAAWDGHREVERHLEVRLVVARKPVAGVFVLALRPDLARPLLDVLIGREKIEPSLGDSAVCNAYLRGAGASGDRNADRRAVVDVT